jgi:integrase/recombinase XerC
MSEPLLPAPRGGANELAPAKRVVTPGEVLADFKSTFNDATIKAYEGDVKRFAEFLNVAPWENAAMQFLECDPGLAHMLVARWVRTMKDEGLSSSTINRRLTAIRSLLRVARMRRVIDWGIDTKDLKVLHEKTRDTSGPPYEVIVSLLARLDRMTDAKSVRDTAIIGFLFRLGFRRFEAAGLDLKHVDFEKRVVHVLGKGRRMRHEAPLPEKLARSVSAWLEFRGGAPGPLFVPVTKGGNIKNMNRLDGSAVHRLVRQAGELVGIELWPHALRHSAITRILDASGGNLRLAQAFSRHSDVNMLKHYDDKLPQIAREAVELL